MDNIIIRGFHQEDTNRLVDIALKAWAPIFDFYNEELGDDLYYILYPDWRREKERQIREFCERAADRVFVAEKDSIIVGFVTFSMDNDNCIGEIGNNAVHPDFQGQGIAPVLYDHVFGILKQAGIRYVKVKTGGDPAHAPARRAYEKANFNEKLPDVTYYKKI
jgi:ribosomal protein S18 acetylase RimI-like enzyme